MPAAWLVLPTYNEAENLERIVRASLPELAKAAEDHHILVVDDGSPDGTGEIADRLAAELGPVEVLHRSAKEGLGRAYLAGFERALASGADLVLGSRYVPGGGVTDWGLLRRMLSRGGSWYARIVLGVPVRDLTGGFKCFHRRTLEGIDYRDTHADGYGFQIEITYRAIQAGFRVKEIPIVFRDRTEGTSKMSPRIALEAVWKVPALRARGG